MSASLRVILTESVQPQRDRLVSALRGAGYDVTVETAPSNEALFAAVAEQTWDVALLGEPDASPEALQRIGWLASVLVLLDGSERRAADLIRAGAYDCLPLDDLARLAPVVARGLRQTEDRRARVKAEVARQAALAQYREHVENANDIVFTIDLAGNFTSFNRAGERISGYSRDELRSMNMARVLAPESLGLASKMIQQKLIDSRPTVYELELVAKDGHLVPIEVNTRLLTQTGTPIGVQGIARDVTERKKVEAEMRARERKQAAVAELGQRALANSNPDELFDAAAQCVAGTLDIEYCTILESLGGDTLLARAGVGWEPGLIGRKTIGSGLNSQAGYALHCQEPVILSDPDSESRFNVPSVLTEHGVNSGASVIIHGPERPFGVLSAFSTARRDFNQDDIHFLQAVANVLGTAIERARLEQERTKHSRELATRVLQAQEEERKRIARELHDETSQSLSTLLINLDLLEPRLAPDDPVLKAGFDRVGALARRTLDEVRALSHDLRPTILDDVGLSAAVQWFAEEYEHTFGGTVELQTEPEVPLAPEVEVAIFRIAQEALNNVGKHAHARSVRVSLSFPGDSVRLVIDDDGDGFNPSQVANPTREGRLGLYGMSERATLLGGSFTIASAPGNGTRITLEVPLADSPLQPVAPAGRSNGRA